VVGNYEDVGLQAKIKGIGQYERDAKKVQRGMNQIGDSAVRSAGRTRKLGTAFTALLKPMLAIATVYAGMRVIGGMIKATAEFEQAIANAASVTGKSGKEFEQAVNAMNETALQLSAGTKYTAREVAAAFYDLASKGFDVAKLSAEELKPILDFAAATNYDLALSTELVTGVLRAFGLGFDESSRVADVFAKAIGSSAATAEKLGLSMSYVGPMAAALNRPLEEQTAILAVLYNRNIEASTAGTGLRMVYMKLMTPSKEVNDILASIGLTMEDVNPATHSLAEILRTLDEAGMSTSQAMDLFEARAGAIILALMGVDEKGRKAYDTIGDLTDVFNKSGDAAEQMAKIQLDTLSSQFTLLKSAVEALVIRFTQTFAPAMKEGVEATAEFIRAIDIEGAMQAAGQALEPFITAVKEIGGVFIDFARQVGPPLIRIFKLIGQALFRINPFVIILRRTWEALTSESGLMGKAMSGLKAIFDRIAAGLEAISHPASAVMSAMRNLAVFIEAAFNTILDMVLPILEDLWNQIVVGWQEIEPLIEPALDAIATLIKRILGNIVAFWDEHGARILAIIRAAWETVGVIVKGALKILIGLIKPILKIIADDWEGAWEDIKKIPGIVFDAILEVAKKFGELLLKMLKFLVKALRLEDAWYGLRDFVLKVWHDIANGIKKRVNDVIGYINGLIGAIDKVARIIPGIPEIEFRMKKFDIEEFIPSPRPGWFGDEATDDMERFRKNVEDSESAWSDFVIGLFKWDAAKPIDEVADASLTAEERLAILNQELVSLEEAARQGAGGAIDALGGLKEQARSVEGALRDAQDAMRGFSDPRLVGMQAAEDELFELEMAIKRARLAELGLGEEATDAAKEVKAAAESMGAGFDLLAAQQRELAEGIPVPFQKAMWEIEQAQRKVAIEPYEGIAATVGQEVSEVQRLRRLREARQIMYDLTYEPQLRRLRETFEDLTGANEEITFEQAMLGLHTAHEISIELTDELADYNQMLRTQGALIGDNSEQTAEIKRIKAEIAELESDINATLAFRLDMEENLLLYHQDQAKSLREQERILKRLYGYEPEVSAEQREYLEAISRTPGLQTGGKVTRGGSVMVGERGPELATLPTGTTVLPHGAAPPAQISRSTSDTWNITQARETVDVVNEIRKYNAFRRIMGGR